MSPVDAVIRIRERSMKMIELIVNDNCLIPDLIRETDLIQVIIGPGHDFDNILDLCAGLLTNDEIAHIHRLWSDDDFPRTFTREGDSLIIRERS
jgi:hypothetical protein